MSRRSALRYAFFLILAILGLALIAFGLFFEPFRPRHIEAASPELAGAHPAVEIARAYLAERPVAARGAFLLPDALEIRNRFQRESNDPNAPVEGLSALLADASPDVRRQAVFFLGALHDGAALPTIARALKDADATVRRAACQSLASRALDADVRATLEDLVRNDAAVRVRVAAAQKLDAKDDAAVAAYRLGLDDYWLRQECEDALAELGKLELPLPDRMYWHATQSQYDEYIKDRKVKRDLRKNGRIYFEVEELVCSGGPNHLMRLQRFWYRAEEAGKVDNR